MDIWILNFYFKAVIIKGECQGIMAVIQRRFKNQNSKTLCTKNTAESEQCAEK